MKSPVSNHTPSVSLVVHSLGEQRFAQVPICVPVQFCEESMEDVTEVCGCHGNISYSNMTVNHYSSGSLSSAVVQSINDLSAKLVECAQFTAQLLEFVETTYS